MDDADFSSLSQGVFVVPYQSDNDRSKNSEAGPSRLRRPVRRLKKVYERECRRLQATLEPYEQEQVDALIDDIRDWLDACDRPPLLSFGARPSRLNVAILQSGSVDMSTHLLELAPKVYTLQGRDVVDLASAIRDIATGLSSGTITYNKTSGTAGLDALERHLNTHKTTPPALLHIAQAQAVPRNILSELLYVLGRHSSLSLRVILSVPSASLFTSSFQHVDPTALDVSILRPPGGKRRNGAVASLMEEQLNEAEPSLLLSQEILEELRTREESMGGGQLAAAKVLRWLLLRSSQTSQLAMTVSDNDFAGLQAAVDTAQALNDASIMADLLDPAASEALEANIDPAPRMSLLKAMSDHGLFLKVTGQGPTGTSPRANGDDHRLEDGVSGAGGSLHEVERLFELYASAGRTINLWDWLQGFEDFVARDGKQQANGDLEEESKGVNDEASPSTKQKRASGGSGDDDIRQDQADEHEDEEKDVDESEQDRLHSSFIRFCEEARMMGLLRARGRGKADEVVKGIGFV